MTHSYVIREFRLEVFLTVDEFSDNAEEFLSKTFDTPQFTGKIFADEVAGCKHTGIPQRFDVTAEIVIKVIELLDGDVNDNGVLDQIVLFVREFTSFTGHIVKVHGKFSRHSVCCLLPTAGLKIEIHTPQKAASQLMFWHLGRGCCCRM